MTDSAIQINGYCAPGVEALAQAFADNFRRGGEQGAALTVIQRGEVLAQLWAGTRDKAQSQPWQVDTRVNIFSAGKALAAACVLQLVESGQLALDAPVAEYWPEFSAQGKQGVTLRQVLCHRSGMSAFDRRQRDEVIFDWAAVTAEVAAAKPWWTPDSAQGYSPMLFGWLLGELVRRVSGSASFNHYFQAHVARPLQLAADFGVAENQLAGLADVGALKVDKTAPAGELAKLIKSDPRGVANQAFTNPVSLMLGTNSPAWRQAQIPAANGHASATALARFYQALSGNGGGILAAANLPWCWQQQSFEYDRVLATPLRFSLGFMLSQPQRADCRFGAGERGFGHPGAGGSLGFGDPDRQLGFGYVTNRMGQNVLMDPRAVRLVDALDSCVS